MQPSVSADEVSERQRFEATCSSLHGGHCNMRFSANSPSRVVAAANEHGAAAHGFTPAYYSQARLDAMLANVMGQAR